MRVIDAAPYWMQHELQRLLGERVMRGLHPGVQQDELRRCREALDWLNMPLRPAASAGTTTEGARATFDRWLAEGFTDEGTPLDDYGAEVLMQARAALAARPAGTTTEGARDGD